MKFSDRTLTTTYSKDSQKRKSQKWLCFLKSLSSKSKKLVINCRNDKILVEGEPFEFFGILICGECNVYIKNTNVKTLRLGD